MAWLKYDFNGDGKKYIPTTHVLKKDYYQDICPYCNRTVPDETWFTKNGKCIWCDCDYHSKKEKKK